MDKESYINTKYEVLTPDGFKPFAGISLMNVSNVWRVETKSGLFIECTSDHKLFINGELRLPLSDIKIGDELFTSDGYDEITKIEDTGRVEPVYDLIEVKDGHRYYANGILSSNCQFITFQETLINPAKLAQIEGIRPIRKSGQVRWYSEINSNNSYVISLDPAMGTGGDNAAIQVFELPTLVQVAEWQHNKTPIEGQMRTLREIGHELTEAGATDIYWSVENNSLGEAALVIIRDTGEESFPGTMLHDPHNKIAGKRKGFGTTHRSKLEACAKLKRFTESGKLKIRSRNLISELKVFVSRANTYEARPGFTDDLVMSTLLFLRMADFIATWDDLSYEMLNSSIDVNHDDDEEHPLPVLFL